MFEIYHHLLDDGPSYFGGRSYKYLLGTEPDFIEYVFCMPVTQRSVDSWEAHCWNSLKYLLPDLPLAEWPSILLFIRGELVCREPSFKYLLGTFLRKTVRAQRRLFRSMFDLVEVGKKEIRHNSKTGELVVFRFEPVGGKGHAA